MSESLHLVSDANNFLDSVSAERGDAANRLEKLNEFKARMIANGFNAPFGALMASAKEAQKPGADEVADQKKHASYMRYVAKLKKFTLNRVRVAIAAHKMAQALEDANLDEMKEFLPYGGEYRKMLTKEGEYAADGYKSLLSRFEQKRYPMKSASALISLMHDGEEVERTVQIDASKNAAQTIEKMFGKSAKVKDVQLMRKAAGLIKNYSTKVALFSAACIYASKKAQKEALREERENKALAKYNQILREEGLCADCTITHADRFENVKKRMQKEGFVQKIGADMIMDAEFEALLHRRRAQKRKDSMQMAAFFVYKILSWYYVCMHEAARKAYSALPSVLAEPDEAHLSIMEDLVPPEYAIAHPAKTIWHKIKMEENAPPLSSAAWGPALVCIKEGVGASFAAKEFNVPKEEVEGAIGIVKSLIEKPHGRGAKFLKNLKE
ncbi:hypothetical protein COU37_00510 [Candidatus Micrarchaeota archaeon CG10_big_fil_rev_8_21_14_0_10_45_29]|nr:MAG: hypothetical protein COU37_00510 [Candidatus Micrarchaeota archaeon CG10_big_fil_rev_8_21_14_0_10_45_29]